LADESRDIATAELVSTARVRGRLRTWQVIAMLAAILISLVGGCLISDRIRLIERAGLKRSPAELAERSREILRSLGYPIENKPDAAWGYRYRYPYFRQDVDRAKDEILFWYRQDADSLRSLRSDVSSDQFSHRVAFLDPPMDRPGMLRLQLRPDGRIVSLETTEYSHHGDPATFVPDWSDVFRWAGLDLRDYERELSADRETSSIVWTAKSRGAKIPKVKGATTNGHITSFSVVPDEKPKRLNEETIGSPKRGNDYDKVMKFTLLTVALWLLHKHYRAGCCDFGGANRLALSVLVAKLFVWALIADRRAGFALSLADFRQGLSSSFVTAVGLWLMYVSVEPLIRRRWPERLVGWNRLYRAWLLDARVGREVLIGITLACTGVFVIAGGHDLLRRRLGWNDIHDLLYPTSLSIMLGWNYFLAIVPQAFTVGLEYALPQNILPVILLHFFRVRLLAYSFAVAIFTGFLTVYFGVGADRFVPYAAILGIMYVVVSVRFGLLPSVTMNVVLFFLFYLPATPRIESWYFTQGLMGGIALFAISVAAAVVACCGYEHARQS
jgi:hypothetical protein